MKIALVLMGAILGGLFMNAKMTPPVVKAKAEVVLGTRIGPDQQLMLVVK